MTAGALRAGGMMDARSNWTGKYGVRSVADFLADPDAQEMALTDLLNDTERQLRANGAFDYVGTTIDGLRARFTITRAGLIAAAHREGPRDTRDYLRRIQSHDFVSRDRDLTKEDRRVETRLRMFSDASYE